jgi:hypothetical protein
LIRKALEKRLTEQDSECAKIKNRRHDNKTKTTKSGQTGTNVRDRNQLHRRLRRGVSAFLHVVLRILTKARFERPPAPLSFHVDKGDTLAPHWCRGLLAVVGRSVGLLLLPVVRTSDQVGMRCMASADAIVTSTAVRTEITGRKE